MTLPEINVMLGDAALPPTKEGVSILRWFAKNALPLMIFAHGCFPELSRTLIAAHFNDVCTDFDLDSGSIEGAVARRTGFFSHDSSPNAALNWASSGDHF
jgi:hypothetical protein